jgi:hypothetical protein
VVTVAGDLSHRPGDARLDPVLELLRGCGHPLSVARAHRYTS